MTRLRLLLPVLLALLAACEDRPSDEKGATANGNVAGGTGGATTKRDPVAPPGGLRNIQKSHDELVEEVEKQEARRESGEGVDERLLENQIRLADNLIKTCEIASRNEAEQIIRKRYAQMRSEFGEMQAKLGSIGEEILEVKRILENIKAGGRPPEGFTVDELRDRLDDLEKELEDQRGKIEDYKIELRKYEDVIASGTFPTPEEGTVFTEELEALKKTRDRLTALRPS